MSENNNVSKGSLAVVITSPNGKSESLHNLAIEFSIYEDIFSSSMSSSIVIGDSVNLVPSLPIVGGESLQYDLESHADNFSLRGTNFVYKMSEKVRQKQDLDIYTLFCTTPENLNDATLSVEKPYFNNTISDYVSKIVEEYVTPVSGKRLIRNTPSFGLQNFTTVSVSPFTYINFLTSEAKSAVDISSNYVFFESKSGYSFATIESLMAQSPKDFFVFDVEKSPVGKGSSYNQGSQSINFINQNETFDLLGNQIKGQYAIRTSFIDPIRKKYGFNDYNYSSNFSDTFHIGNRTRKTATDDVVNFVASKPTVEKFIVTNSGFQESDYVLTRSEESNRVRQRQEFASYERATMSQLHAIRAHIRVPGNPYLEAGDTVQIVIPEIGGKDNDRLLSGKYLVTSLRHTYNTAGQSFATTLEIMKDSYEGVPE